MDSIIGEKINELVERGVISEILPNKEEFIKAFKNKKDFHIYIGIDPTLDRLHLGHVQNILFLEDMRRLGAKTTLLIGEFTGLIGDPTGKLSKRKQLTKSNIRNNISSWKKQIKPIINLSFFSGTKITTNSNWFNLFSASDLIEIMKEVTTQHLLERDMFQERLKKGSPLYLNELIYPILQGYDSVALDVDCELCGTDQTFNALVGRTFVKRFLNKEKFIVSMNLISADNVLMSKSNGTGVFIDIDSNGHNNMFGSIMSLSDGFILPLFKGCTRINQKEINEIEKKLNTSDNPFKRDAKIMLATEIVKMFHGDEKANIAKDNFICQFNKHETPKDATKISINNGSTILDVVSTAMRTSNSKAKNLIREGAVYIEDKKIIEVDFVVDKKFVGKSLKIGRFAFIFK